MNLVDGYLGMVRPPPSLLSPRSCLLVHHPNRLWAGPPGGQEVCEPKGEATWNGTWFKAYELGLTAMILCTCVCISVNLPILWHSKLSRTHVHFEQLQHPMILSRVFILRVADEDMFLPEIPHFVIFAYCNQTRCLISLGNLPKAALQSWRAMTPFLSRVTELSGSTV